MARGGPQNLPVAAADSLNGRRQREICSMTRSPVSTMFITHSAARAHGRGESKATGNNEIMRERVQRPDPGLLTSGNGDYSDSFILCDNARNGPGGRVAADALQPGSVRRSVMRLVTTAGRTAK